MGNVFTNITLFFYSRSSNIIPSHLGDHAHFSHVCGTLSICPSYDVEEQQETNIWSLIMWLVLPYFLDKVKKMRLKMAKCKIAVGDQNILKALPDVLDNFCDLSLFI